MASATTDRDAGARFGASIKEPCVVATTAAITLSGEQSIDGVSVTAGDRVLVKDQSDAKENGIYIANTSSWSRSRDFNGTRDIVRGTQVYVFAGSAQGAGIWRLTTDSPVIGSSNIVFAQDASGSGSGTASNWGDLGGTLADQTDLQSALDGKANSSHTHTASDITDFDTEVDSRIAAKVGTDNISVVSFTPDGVETTFAIGQDPGTKNNLKVFLDGVYQQQDAFTISSNNIVFNTAPPADIERGEIHVYLANPVGTVSDGAVSYAKLDSSLQDRIDGKAEELNDLSDVTVSSPADGEALLYDSVSGSFENAALPVDDAANVGASGEGVYAGTSAGQLQFKKLIGGTSTTLTADASTITIDVSAGASAGETNTASNVGTGGADVFKQKSGVDLEFRQIKAGTNVTVTENTNDITIDASAAGEANTGSNLGSGGSDVFKQKTGVDFEFRQLKAGANVTLTENADDITIAADPLSAVSIEDLTEVTATTETRSTDAGVNQIEYNMAAEDMFRVRQGTTAGHEFSHTMFVDRVADYSGGQAGWVNSAVFARTRITNADAVSYEWAVTGTVINYANAGENVGVFGQCRAMTSTTGPSWAMVANARDESGAERSGGALTGIEVDVIANGPNPLRNRLGVHVVSGKALTGATSECWAGVYIATRKTPNEGTYEHGIHIGNDPAAPGAQRSGIDKGITIDTDGTLGIRDRGTKNTGIQLEGNYSGSALRVASGEKISLTTDNTVSLRWGGLYIECSKPLQVTGGGGSGKAVINASGASGFQYGIDFGTSASFTSGYVLRSGIVNITDGGLLEFRKQSLFPAAGSLAGYLAVRVGAGNAFYKIPLHQT